MLRPTVDLPKIANSAHNSGVSLSASGCGYKITTFPFYILLVYVSLVGLWQLSIKIFIASLLIFIASLLLFIVAYNVHR